jgi:phage major head subunit gpT-like protein
MLLNAATIAALQVSWKAAFQNAFDAAQPLNPQFAMPVPSSGSSEIYPWLGEMPGFREWLGDREVKNISVSKYEIVNKRYELTVKVLADNIRDDKMGIYAPLMSGMGASARLHPDELIFSLLAAGASTACYDEQYFFATTHPILKGTSTASNYDATTGGAKWILMDTTKMIKPVIRQDREPYSFLAKTAWTDENVFNANEFVYGATGRTGVGFGLWQLAYMSLNTLDATTFVAARAAMMALKNDEGRPLGIRPNLCVVSTGRYTEAETLFKAPTGAAGASNPHYNECAVIHAPLLD